MNKQIIIIFLIAVVGFWACDTQDSLEPIDDSFFIKLYAGVNEGEQFGNDIIATSDGGLLIAGTSVDNISNTSEILLIKTDARGNELWTFGASDPNALGELSFSVAASVIESTNTNSYFIGGTVGENSERKSVIIEINIDGTFKRLDITDTNIDDPGSFNVLKKISLGLSGILVTGETSVTSASGGGGINGFVRLYDETTLVPDTIDTKNIWFFGIEGDDHVAGGYEVSDPGNFIGGQNSRFLIFGSSIDPDNSKEKFFYQGYNDLFSPNPSIKATQTDLLSGNQSASYVTQFNDTYWVIGNLDQKNMFLLGWEFKFDDLKGNDWSPIGTGVINTIDIDDKIGKGVAVQADNKYVVVGDIIFTTDHKEIYLGRTNSNPSLDLQTWPKTFGTSSSAYSASAVTTLADGSIIIVGTADLQPIKKIIVIKTGPNGEMSF